MPKSQMPAQMPIWHHDAKNSTKFVVLMGKNGTETTRLKQKLIQQCYYNKK